MKGPQEYRFWEERYGDAGGAFRIEGQDIDRDRAPSFVWETKNDGERDRQLDRVEHLIGQLWAGEIILACQRPPCLAGRPRKEGGK